MSGLVWLLLLCAAAGAVCLLVLMRRRRTLEEQARAPKSPEELASEQALRTDKEAQAQLLAGNLEAARKLFIEARRPGKAAQVAVREGRFDLAGELFEKDGRLDKALVAYRKAGLAHKVASLEQRLTAPKAGAASPTKPPASAPGPERRSQSHAPSAESDDDSPLALPQLGDLFAGPPSDRDDWADARPEESEAWLLEDGLLDLPGAPPSARPNPPPATASQSAASRVALGVIALIKPRRPRAAVVEETAPTPRRINDDR